MDKYYLTYTGIDRAVYLFEIFEEGFDGESIEIHGYVNYNYATRKDLLEALIASSLDISLEADENLTLQDLYTEEESKFKCSLKRNDKVIFYGILKPDGIWEDFVSNRWEISMDAMDGLSILKDLSFVKDNGTFYEGKITQFEALKQCLKRIGYELPINISKDLPTYSGFSSNDSILKSVLMNADRFYQDKKTDAIMDCEEVLKSILEPYNATIIQMNGEWWVYRSIDVADSMAFIRYDGETKTDIVWNADLNIGSHIDEFDIFHIGTNQKKSINPSTQAFRVNYKYGEVQNALQNPELIFESDYTADGWLTDNDPDYVYVDLNNGIGVHVDEYLTVDSAYFYWDLLTLDQSVSVKIGQNINVQLDFITSLLNGNDRCDINFYLSTPNFIFQNGEWKPKPATPELYSHSQNIGNGNGDISVSFGNAPETGNISLRVGVSLSFSGIDTLADFDILLTSILLNQGTNKVIHKGEFHTAQRMTRISSVTKSDKTVSVGDSISDFYYGTLYKADGSPTEFWGGKPLLQRMVEDTIRIAPRPMCFFEGDVCGYFPYLSNVLINNVSGKYQVAKYSYDTRTNVNRANFREYDNAVLIEDADFTYEFAYDYGQITKVTVI